MRRTVFAVFVSVVLAACGNQTTMAMIDAPPLALPMHVVVNASAVAIYMNGADYAACGCAPSMFPDEGTCSFGGDGGPCNNSPSCTSCLEEVEVEQGGTRLTARTRGTDPHFLVFDAISEAPLAVVLAGCGHPETRIPIDGAAFPSADVHGDVVGGVAHASWSTNALPAEALVTFRPGANDFAGSTCFVSGATDYSATQEPDSTGVEVQPLGARAEIETEVGHVTVWRAGDGYAPIPRP